mmetsp:Transcript_15633/g.27669  ORF Transcript_15633/g.27669 Transcript_15633/m.27669 type:complete len:200 (-) Transcript_15633:53-652(-)
MKANIVPSCCRWARPASRRRSVRRAARTSSSSSLSLSWWRRAGSASAASCARSRPSAASASSAHRSLFSSPASTNFPSSRCWASPGWCGSRARHRRATTAVAAATSAARSARDRFSGTGLGGLRCPLAALALAGGYPRPMNTGKASFSPPAPTKRAAPAPQRAAASSGAPPSGPRATSRARSAAGAAPRPSRTHRSRSS